MTVVNAASVCSTWTLIAFYRACLAEVDDDQNPACACPPWSASRHSVGLGSLLAPPVAAVRNSVGVKQPFAGVAGAGARVLAATGLPSDASAYCFEAKWDGSPSLNLSDRLREVAEGARLLEQGDQPHIKCGKQQRLIYLVIAIIIAGCP